MSIPEDPKNMRAGSAFVQNPYQGVIRIKSRPVWHCEHNHGTSREGRECAQRMIAFLKAREV